MKYSKYLRRQKIMKMRKPEKMMISIQKINEFIVNNPTYEKKECIDEKHII